MLSDNINNELEKQTKDVVRTGIITTKVVKQTADLTIRTGKIVAKGVEKELKKLDNKIEEKFNVLPSEVIKNKIYDVFNIELKDTLQGSQQELKELINKNSPLTQIKIKQEQKKEIKDIFTKNDIPFVVMTNRADKEKMKIVFFDAHTMLFNDALKEKMEKLDRNLIDDVKDISNSLDIMKDMKLDMERER